MTSKTLELKRQRMIQQLDALGCDSYRITLKSRRDGLNSYNMCRPPYRRGVDPKPNEILFTRKDNDVDLMKWLPEAETQNIRGYDVYITPVDSTLHCFLLDDLTAEGLQTAKSKYDVSWVQISSENNYQAIVRAKNPSNTKIERRVANRMIQKMNEECGGDIGLSGVQRPFRAVGFANKKPERHDEYTRCVYQKKGIVCSQATAELNAIRELTIAEEPARQAKKKELAARRKIVDKILKDEPVYEKGNLGIEKHFRRRWRWHYERARAKVLKGEWRNISYDKIDYSVIRDLITDGYHPGETARCLEYQSPSFLDRKNDNVNEVGSEYARRTVASVIRCECERGQWSGTQIRGLHRMTKQYIKNLHSIGKTAFSAGMQAAMAGLDEDLKEGCDDWFNLPNPGSSKDFNYHGGYPSL